METKEIEIDGIKFILNSMKALEAMKLDKKLISILLPAFNGLKGLSMDANIDFGAALEGLSNSLLSMKDDEYEKFIRDMFSNVQAIKPGSPAMELRELDAINTIFAGSTMTVYKLIWEVAKFNKFLPFELVGGGTGMSGIFTSLMGEESMEGVQGK